MKGRLGAALARLCLKTPSSGPRASVFLPGKDGEAGDVSSIVDAAGCSQEENKPLEARWGFQTEPCIAVGTEKGHVDMGVVGCLVFAEAYVAVDAKDLTRHRPFGECCKEFLHLERKGLGRRLDGLLVQGLVFGKPLAFVVSL